MSVKFNVVHATSKKNLEKNPQWNMPYVPAIQVLEGNPLYLSGVNAAPIYHCHPHQPQEFDDLDFSVVGQAKHTMENLKNMLNCAGGSFEHIVQMIIFIVDAQRYGDEIGQVISSYFSGHRPTSTVVGVSNLITDSRLILEVTATAYI